MCKNISKKVFAWFGVFLLGLTTLVVPYFSIKNAYALDADYAAIATNYEKASRIQRVVHATVRCMREGNFDNNAVDINDAEDYFDSSTYNIPAGPWLEDQVQGKVDDGAFECDQKGGDDGLHILEVFARELGYSLVNDIACDGDKKGILTPRIDGEYKNEKGEQYGDYHCNSYVGMGDDYSFQWRTRENAEKHIKKLYERYVKNHPEVGVFLPSWQDVINKTYADTNLYYAYLDDFWWACASGESWGDDIDLAKKGDFWTTKVTTMNKKTGKFDVKKYYKVETTASGNTESGDDIDNDEWDYSIKGSGKGAITCQAVIKELNKLAPKAEAAIAKYVEDGYKTSCNDQFDKTGVIAADGINLGTIHSELQIAQDIIDDPEATRQALRDADPNADDSEIEAGLKEKTKRAKEVKDELEKLKDSGQYWEEVPDGEGEKSIVCKVFPTVNNGDVTPGSTFEVTTFVNSSSKKDDGDYCYSAGLDSMAWILCPATTNMSSAVSGISGILDDWLSTDTRLYDNNSGTKTAWNIFQGIANVALIIVLLVIIFSQLTGYGIDNYGIKRMLPRLIVMAILINLSFIICQIAIDLSNILGQGLNSLFSSIGQTIMRDNGVDPSEIVVSNVVTDILGTIAGAGVVGSIALQAFSGGGAAIIFSLILALLVALVAVLLFFVMLGARMIVIIMFTAIAPVAFACYILPNTQNLFKKWWNIFKTALIVYPICGALYGMSDIIKAVIWSDGNGVHVFMGIVAVCAPFIPFLVLPGLLKGALAALGAVGATIGALGAGLRGGLQKSQDSLKDSAAYKNAQERAKEVQASRWAKRTTQFRNGQKRIDDNGFLLNKDGSRKTSKMPWNRGQERRASGAQMAAFAAARNQTLKDKQTELDRKRVSSDAGYSSKMSDILASDKAEAIASQERTLKNGEAAFSGGKVNPANLKQVGQFHKESLADYRAAMAKGDQVAADEAMARVKAAQNILTKAGEHGQDEVIGNFKDSIRSGDMAGLSEAAAHLQSEHALAYKAGDQGASKLIEDLSNRTSVADIQAKLDGDSDKGYDWAGTDKYTAESLPKVNETAINNMAGAIAAGKVNGDALTNIMNTASQTFDLEEAGKISLKPEERDKVTKILASCGEDTLAKMGDTNLASLANAMNSGSLRGRGRQNIQAAAMSIASNPAKIDSLPASTRAFIEDIATSPIPIRNS